MKTILKIFLISLLAIIAIFLLAKMAISFFNPESAFSGQSFSIQKPKSLPNVILLTALPSASAETGELPPQINFLLLGLPGRGNNAPGLSDTIMLATLKPQEKRIYFFSVPRDLYVKSENGDFAKINSLYILGKNKNSNSPANNIIKAVEKVAGQKIDYFITMDLPAVKKIVDDLGGLNVNVSETVRDPMLSGIGNGYETFYIEKGWRYFEGQTTLKYLRTRSSSNGDFDRMRRQQDILEAFRKKIFGLNLFWDFPKIIKIYSQLQNNIETNMTTEEMRQIYKIVKEIEAENMAYEVIEKKETGLVVTDSAVTENGSIASIVRPSAGLENYEEIQEFIKNTLNE